MKQKKYMKRGKKVRIWDKIRAELKQEFLEMGVGSCELRMKNCQGSSFLGFAHSKKRRFIDYDDPDGDLRTVILACVVCHANIERLSHEEMERIVLETINKRSDLIYGMEGY